MDDDNTPRDHRDVGLGRRGNRVLGEAEPQFCEWTRAWLDLAEYQGRLVPDPEGRIAKLVELWHAPVPPGWKRMQDARLVDPGRRYGRNHTGGAAIPRGEHAIEYEILNPSPSDTVTICLGARLIDGVNAVPLAKDIGGGRTGNVEADMVLLVRTAQEWRLLLVELKATSNNAWYAAVENLRQMRLFLDSTHSRRLFHTRHPRAGVPEALPTTAIVLAPRAFYTAPGAKTAAVAPAERLLERFRKEIGIDAQLTTWDPVHRVVAPW
jgi:hypothetical protein